MKRHDQWNVTVDMEEQPDYNFYTVDFQGHKSGEDVARVTARIYTNFDIKVNNVQVERLDEDALKDTPDSRLIEIAEIEINSVPGLGRYVEIPGSHPVFTYEK
ncbi:MAG: hypothetical protein JWQ02_673 [Capsulimonas sp.]|nr:hypothetical protein [Capsulimonas sp.]